MSLKQNVGSMLHNPPWPIGVGKLDAELCFGAVPSVAQALLSFSLL